jgi:signal peptidase
MTDENTSTTTTGSRLENIPWRKIANAAGILLLVAVVVPFVVFAVPQVVGADQSYVVLSGSMEPAMSPGDVIIVNSVPASAIERNDVITFGGQGGDTPTTHRVIEVVEQDGTTAFRTQGDANDDPDGALVTPDQIQGKVLSPAGYLLVIPFIGYLINFASTQSGLVLFVALPVSLLVLNEIWNIIASTRSGPEPDDNADAEAAVDTGAGAGEAVEGEVTAQDDDVAAASDSGDAGISFTAAELQLGLGVNAAFLAYSIWVAYSIWTAYDTVETWALGAVGGVGASFLLLGGLYLFGGSDESTDERDHSPESNPDGQSELPDVSVNGTDETRADGEFVYSWDPDMEAKAEAAADDVSRRTNGDGQTASSERESRSPVSDPNTSEGETNA